MCKDIYEFVNRPRIAGLDGRNVKENYDIDLIVIEDVRFRYLEAESIIEVFLYTRRD